MQTIEQDCMYLDVSQYNATKQMLERNANEMLTKFAQVRFNVLRVLPRTGKAVKQFNKF